jgi:hypothetical protein
MAMNRSPGSREVLELLGEDHIVADIVGVGCDGGKLVGQRHDAEARVTVEAAPLHDVAGEVRSGGGAAAIAANEYVAPRVAGFLEPFDGLVHLVQVDRFDGLQQFGSILLGERHIHSMLIRC